MSNITYLFTWIWDLLGSIVINVGSYTFSPPTLVVFVLVHSLNKEFYVQNVSV